MSDNLSDLLNEELKKDRGLRTTVTCLEIGTAAMLIVSVYSWWHNSFAYFLQLLGLSIILGLAATVTGGFLGFLFGIPRSLQKLDTTPQAGSLAHRDRAYDNNTNLEQISDWLTKIIVGISLVELPNISTRFNNLTSYLSIAFTPTLSPAVSQTYVYALLVFYSVCGFFGVYLWSRIYLLKQLIMGDRALDERISVVVDDKIKETVATVATQVGETVSNVETRIDEKFETQKIRRQLDEFDQVKKRIISLENKPENKHVILAAQPGPIRYLEDCQKGRWGAISSNNGYSLTATFSKDGLVQEDSYYLVTLIVTGAPEKQLEGEVYFFLHDTYYPECIQHTTAKDNRASITIPSYEAFTVGCFCEQSHTKLELDLNEYAGTPGDYKYKDTLVTFEQLQQQLAVKEAAEAAPPNGPIIIP